LQRPEGKTLVVTIGHANANKRILEVIEAIGTSRTLSGRILYAIVGASDGTYRQALLNAIKKFHLEETVRLTGFVGEDVLTSYLMHANICVNLRRPAMEGASASAIEEMLQGKPVIVSDNGFYGELPSEAVYKVAPGEEVQRVAEALLRLSGDPALGMEMGARGKRFASEQALPARYAAGFLEFANEVMDVAPLLKFIDRAAMQIQAMGVAPDASLPSTVAEVAYELFCANGCAIKPLPE
jgi:glycosyltransferase involved in cell wall biosynthesis